MSVRAADVQAFLAREAKARAWQMGTLLKDGVEPLDLRSVSDCRLDWLEGEAEAQAGRVAVLEDAVGQLTAANFALTAVVTAMLGQLCDHLDRVMIRDAALAVLDAGPRNEQASGLISALLGDVTPPRVELMN